MGLWGEGKAACGCWQRGRREIACPMVEVGLPMGCGTGVEVAVREWARGEIGVMVVWGLRKRRLGGGDGRD